MKNKDFFFAIRMVTSGKQQVDEEIMCGLGSMALPTYFRLHRWESGGEMVVSLEILA